MMKLYLDCDGVILDTINKSYQMLRESGITEESEVMKFYSNICWETLIRESGEINNSISKIKCLSKYFDVEILTHVYSDSEAKAKKVYFAKVLPGINVITVPKEIKKADYVECKGAILVDDYFPNLEYWEEKGGIPVKFSDSNRPCSYISIMDLLELLEINFNNKIKIKE
jgi:hypothetical protein